MRTYRLKRHLPGRENNEGAHSTLINLDMAEEMITFTAQRILQRSGISMLSHANQMPKNLMRQLLL